MLSSFKNIFQKKEKKASTDFPINIEKELKKCKKLQDYVKLLKLTTDTCYNIFQKRFQYKEKNKIYVMLANIFANATAHEEFSEEEDHVHFYLISTIFNHYGASDAEQQLEKFEECIHYIGNALSEVELNEENSTFFISNAYASYLYPDEEPFKLTLQALTINDFFTPIETLAKQQKNFFSK